MKSLLTLPILLVTAVTTAAQDDRILLAPSPLMIIFEYTLAPDGSRRDIKMIRCEDCATRQPVKGALTENQEQTGANIIAQRKRPSAKDASKKRYDFLLFDRVAHQYLTR